MCIRDSRFSTRAAQGPHKVNIGRVVPEANLIKIEGGNVDETWSGKRGSQKSSRMYGFPFISVIFSVKGSVVSPESLNMHGFPYMFHDFFGGVGSVGSPESLKVYGSPCIYYDFFGGVVSVESLES